VHNSKPLQLTQGVIVTRRDKRGVTMDALHSGSSTGSDKPVP